MIDNTGFTFIYKAERCRSEIKNYKNDLLYSYHFFYNAEEGILRRIDFTETDTPFIINRPFGVWDILHYRPIDYSESDNNNFYLLGITEYDVKILEMILKKYGIEDYSINTNYNSKNSIVSLPITILSFFNDAETATFLFYFNEYIKIS